MSHHTTLTGMSVQSDGPAIDWLRLDTLKTDVGVEAFAHLFAIYVQETETALEKFRDVAHAASSPCDMRRIAHTLKGSSAQVGAMAVSRLAAALERKLKAADAAPTLPEIEALKQAFSAYRAALAEKGVAA